MQFQSATLDIGAQIAFQQQAVLGFMLCSPLTSVVFYLVCPETILPLSV